MGINKDLGLPFGDSMEKVLVAFDVDGTLINEDWGYGRTLTLLDAFLQQPFKNVDVIVWSGGGGDYARRMVTRHITLTRLQTVKGYYSKLEYKELRKKYTKVIAFDDVQDTRLGDVNLIVRNK